MNNKAKSAPVDAAAQLQPIEPKGAVKMPKGQKAPTEAKSVYVKFERQEDLDLYNRLESEAKAKRYDVGTYILLTLLAASPSPAA